MPQDSGSPLAAASAALVAGGAALMLAALVAAPGPWTAGYVSEAGTTGLPFAGGYRAGLVLLALGVALLAYALAPVTRPAGLLLGAAAVLAATSGVVPCSRGCPLPPFEPTTVANLVHTGASIVGMALLALAMLVIAVRSGLRTAQRVLGGAGAAVVVPVGLWLGATMLFTGRGDLGAALERWLLVAAVSWLVGTAILAVPRRRAQNRTVANDPAEVNPHRA